MKGRVINLNGGVYKVILEDGTIKDFKARGKLRAEKVYQSNDKSLDQNYTISSNSHVNKPLSLLFFLFINCIFSWKNE